MRGRKKDERRSLSRREFLRKSAALGFGLTLGAGLNRSRATETISQADAQEQGVWEGPYDMPVVAIHAALLPTWEVLVYSSGSNARVLNWWDWTFRPVPVPGNPNIFCSGHSFRLDGKLLVSGGAYATDIGRPDAYLFDPFTNGEPWTRLQDMARGRWYPTSITLPSGRVMVVSGTDESAQNNNIPELYTPRVGWTELAAAQLNLPTYPYLFVLPDGRVFYAGPGNPTRTLDVATQTWSVVGNSPIGGGSVVMYEPGKVMKSGGGDPAIPRTVGIDMSQESPSWREVPRMEFPRRRHNLTVLPDGKVLVTGGTRVGDEEGQGVHAAELWDPVSETWTTLASMQIARMYHSTALLLPDGRLLSAGGNGKLNAEIFSPPYLFSGPRPEISSAPERIAYTGTFEVYTPDAADIASVALIRPSAVTHAYNQDQRYLRLNFESGDGLLHVQAPANARLAPRGYYMLFLVTNEGVPSWAWFIRLVRRRPRRSRG